jgi:serine phosphatase RsbU (regulator of sigma subunit)
MPDNAVVPSSTFGGTHCRPPCAASVERAFARDVLQGGRLTRRWQDAASHLESDEAYLELPASPMNRTRRPPTRRKRPTKDFSLRRRHETLLSELRLAEQVQRSMLPRILPKLPQVEFGAALRPTQHLAGDFYNVIRLDGDRVGVCLGDVMGHGPAAALLGVFAMQGMRTKTIEGSNYEIVPPAEVVANLSRDLIRADFPDNPFITMIYGVLDTARGVLSYCCGGHPPVILLREGQPPRRLEGNGFVLGVFNVPFEQAEVALLPGDRIALYSDGVESILWGDQGAGVDALASLLSLRDGRSPQELVDDALAVAEPGGGQSDDLTIVLFEMSAVMPQSPPPLAAATPLLALPANG